VFFPRPESATFLLATMLAERRFWKEEQKMKCGFRRKHFSRA
jgi:hypothetical protein